MKTIGPYRVVRELSVGGQARVFEVAHPDLEQTRALKLLTRPVHDGDSSRLRTEWRTLDRLAHPNVVQVLDVGEFDGCPYFVMPLLVGETLERRMRREGRLPIGDAVRIAKQVLAGLAAAHRCDIVHRDLKPANVFLCVDGVVKILDFGLSRPLGRATITASDVVVGTPMYMAPEQVAGAPLDPRVDLYAVGLLLYEALAGTPPFPNAIESVHQMIAHAETAAPPITDAPRALSDLIAAALSKDPAGRPQTAEEFARRLERAVRPARWGRVAAGAAVVVALACLIGWRSLAQVAPAVPPPAPIVRAETPAPLPPPPSLSATQSAPTPVKYQRRAPDLAIPMPPKPVTIGPGQPNVAPYSPTLDDPLDRAPGSSGPAAD